MIEIVGVTLKKGGKIYYFSPNGLKLAKSQNVIVKTERGLQFCMIEIENTEIEENKLKTSLSEVVRVCSKKDNEINEKNIEDAKKALKKGLKYFKGCKKKMYKADKFMVMASLDFKPDSVFYSMTISPSVQMMRTPKCIASVPTSTLLSKSATDP